MKKVYYLPNCDTCQRILKELQIGTEFEHHNIKTQGISLKEVDEMKRRANSYENLFSRRAMKYKAMGLKEKKLQEADYRKLIHQEYTFLKRPVFLIDDHIFIGNSKKNIENIKAYLNSSK